MTADDIGYWQQLWRSGSDSFTLEEPNANLTTHLEDLLPGRSNAPIDPRSVLVPLCGRSVDLVFLESRQRSVWGVDIAGAALQRFAQDHGGGVASSWKLEGHNGSRAYHLRTLPRLTLVHADFLALRPRDYRDPEGAPLSSPLADDDSPPFDAVWDRGGLTSMPPALRLSYASLLHGLLRPGARALVEFLSPSTDLALSEDAVTGLLAGAFTGGRVSRLRRADVRAAFPDFAPPGLSFLDEVVLLAEKRGGGSRAGGAAAIA